jgi:riboflavin kinase/FMN adenylyltransferase
MKILHDAAELPGVPRRVCIAIGVFDGVHLGHQQVIRQTTADASHHEAAAVVVTFDRHPNSVVAPAAVPPAIYSLEQKLAAIAGLGIEATLVIRFDQAFSRLAAEDFIADLRRGFGSLRSVCVGREFTFGHRRRGNVALLERMGDENGFQVHALAALALDGQVVSSTRIRERIHMGDLDAAGQMLGRDYLISGTVISGDHLGEKLGFPTANLDVSGLVTPPSGVYAVHAFHRSRLLRGVANIGSRPSVTSTPTPPRLEVHLLDFNGRLYGETLSIQFIQRLRAEAKFESLEALRDQIRRDVDRARECF